MPNQLETRKKFVSHILLLTFGWLAALFGHLYVVPNAKIPILIAIFDPFVHGLIAFLLILPFYLWKRIDLKYLLVALALAILIDIDHALAARSIRFEDMLTLPARPIGHSVLFCAIISVTAALVLKYVVKSKKSIRLLIYLFFIALFSHIARDAINTTSTPWAYPFDSTSFSELAYFSGFFVLNMAHLYYAFRKNNLPFASWEDKV